MNDESSQRRTPDEPKVAVIIPAYNAARTLARTISSVLAQTMSEFEVVVTDDGSLDDTYDIARSFARNDSRLTVIRQGNKGIADARNVGIHNSRAPLIAAIDSDDVWHPTFLEKLSNSFGRGDERTALAYANSRIIDMDGDVVWNAPSYRQSGWALNQLLIRNFVGNGSAMMYRRDLALSCGAYDSRLQYEYGAAGCDDWLLALNLAARGRVALVPEYLVGYRAVPGQWSEDTLRARRSRLFALEIFFQGVNPSYCKAARWALGAAHAKCFLHEVRDRLPVLAAKNLAAAVRCDFFGTLHLLFGSERVDWLLERVPWRAPPAELGRFDELAPTAGQWEFRSGRSDMARQWDDQIGCLADRLRLEAPSLAERI